MDTSPPETLTAGPVVLRRWRLTDVEELARAVVESADHLRPWTFWLPFYDKDPTAAATEYLRRSVDEWACGKEYDYAITAGGRIVGSCGLMRRTGPRGLEIGYWVHRAHLGQGYATRAVQALTDAAARLSDVDYLELVIPPENARSVAVARRSGFVLDGMRKLPVPVPSSADGMGGVWRRELPAGVVRRLFDAMAAGALDESLSLVSDGFVWRNTSMPTMRGRRALRTVLRAMRAMRAVGLTLTADFVRIDVDGDVVDTLRTDELRIVGLRMRFDVRGRFEVRGGQVVAWHDMFRWRDVARGVAGARRV